MGAWSNQVPFYLCTICTPALLFVHHLCPRGLPEIPRANFQTKQKTAWSTPGSRGGLPALMPRDIMSPEPKHWVVFGLLAMALQSCAEAPPPPFLSTALDRHQVFTNWAQTPFSNTPNKKARSLAAGHSRKQPLSTKDHGLRSKSKI